jgi:hypothetical protein
LTFKAIAAAKAAEAAAAARKANAARLAAARLTLEAERASPMAEGAKYRAGAQLAAAEGALKAANSPLAVKHAEEAKAGAQARLAAAEQQLRAVAEQTSLTAEAAARARDEAKAADAEKLAALEASREAARMLSPLSIFISRKTQRLYVRQAFQELLESPVTIRDAADPIGTHIYTALDYANGDTTLRWSVVSANRGLEKRQTGEDSRDAAAALDRIAIPQDVVDRISERISPGSSLIISDEGMSAETGKDTDFVILISGEPQGGVKIRRRDPPQARARNEREDARSYARRPTSAPAYYGGGGFDRW